MGFENSGRRPKPTALHILNGNPSRKNLNVNEPVPPAGDLVKPDGLSPGAGVIWDELRPILTAMGTLTVADLRPFQSLCELQSTFVAETRLKTEAPEKFSVRQERETAAALRPYYEYFGMTPSSRARLATPKQGKAEPASKWAGTLK